MDKKYKVYKLRTSFFKFINYCYIIIDKKTGDAVVVDPAWELDRITDKLYESDAKLKGVLLTHSHFDHVNLANSLAGMFDSNVYISEAEINYFDFRCRNLQGLKDLDNIYLGETKIRCLLTPGHTPGGMCYMLEDSLFTGDTVFTEGCGACGFDGGSAEQMFSSIQRIKYEVAPYVLVYPGHSYGIVPGQTIDFLYKNNIYFQINEIEDFINFRTRNRQRGLFEFK